MATDKRQAPVRYWYAGAPFKSGTDLPDNVTGECPHRHGSPVDAQACINRLNGSIKRGMGRNAYCDRVVMVAEARLVDGKWLRVSGTTRVWTGYEDEPEQGTL